MFLALMAAASFFRAFCVGKDIANSRISFKIFLKIEKSDEIVYEVVTLF
jgi:uncharacterized protein involved in propanediol utilization